MSALTHSCGSFFLSHLVYRPHITSGNHSHGNGTTLGALCGPVVCSTLKTKCRGPAWRSSMTFPSLNNCCTTWDTATGAVNTKDPDTVYPLYTIEARVFPKQIARILFWMILHCCKNTGAYSLTKTSSVFSDSGGISCVY